MMAGVISALGHIVTRTVHVRGMDTKLRSAHLAGLSDAEVSQLRAAAVRSADEAPAASVEVAQRVSNVIENDRKDRARAEVA